MNVGCDGVGDGGIEDDGEEAGPEIEEADEVEEADGDVEGVFEVGLGVRETLEDGCEGVGEEEGGYEFDWEGDLDLIVP